MAKAIIETTTPQEDKLCSCCMNNAYTVIKVGTNFENFTQTSSIALCREHLLKLKELLDKM